MPGRFDERGPVYRVELVDDLARLLDHRLLVLARGHGRRLEGRDVRRLADRIGEEAHRNALALRRIALDGLLRETAHLDLGLHRGIPLQPGYRHQVHIVKSQFRKLRNLGLDKQRGHCRVKTAGQIIQRHLNDVLPHLLRIVGIVRQRLCVGDHDEDPLEFARVLQLHATAQRAYVMAQMEPTGGSVARQYDFFHNAKILQYATRTRPSGGDANRCVCAGNGLPGEEFSPENSDKHTKNRISGLKKLSHIIFFYIFASANSSTL